MNDEDRIDQLRRVELAYYSSSYDGVSTFMIFDNLLVSQAQARFSMYTTLFITFILVVRNNFEAADCIRFDPSLTNLIVSPYLSRILNF